METCGLIRHHALNLADELAAALGVDFPAQTVVCSIGSSAYSGTNFRKQLAYCREREYALALWWRPGEPEMDKGSVDLEALHEHPSVKDSHDALCEHAAKATGGAAMPGINSILGEAGGFRPDGKTRRYVSPAVYSGCWLSLEALNETIRLPSGARLLRPSAAWHPSGGPGFSKWFTPALLERLQAADGFLDWHPYDHADQQVVEKWWETVHAGMEWATANGIHNAWLEGMAMVGEVAFDHIPDGAWRVQHWMKRAAKEFFRGKGRAWAFPPNYRYPYPWAVSARYAPSLPPHKVFPPGGKAGTPWLGSPEMLAFARELAARPEFVTKPLGGAA